MGNRIIVGCAECNRPIELEKRSLVRYYKRNGTDQYVCASCTASRIGRRPISHKEREQRSKRASELWSRREYREKFRVGHQKVTSRTEFSQIVSENNRKRWAKIKQQEIDEEYRKRVLESKNDPKQ